MGHTRLAIMGPGEDGDQPFHSPDGKVSWVVNGEIYNHEALAAEYGLECRSRSDSEVVGLLYQKLGPDFVKLLDGMWVFTLLDHEKGTVLMGRDHMGISPMFWGRGHDGSLWGASEMKALANVDQVARYDLFPPGHVLTARLAEGMAGGLASEPEIERWYTPAWLDQDRIPTQPADLEQLRKVCVDSVIKRLNVDVPHGVLLSGGLDSSLVTAIAVKHGHEAQRRHQFSSKLLSFCIGIKGAPDLAAARAVAEHLGTEHHEFHFTPEEALDAVPDVVYHIESFQQIRASVPMYLLARKIKAMGVKMVLSGEGAD